MTFDDVEINGYNPDYSGKLNFEYDNFQRIVKVKGGLKTIYLVFPSVTTWAFNDDVSDTITYDGEIISVRYSNNLQRRPFDKEFLVSNGELKSRKVTLYYRPFNAAPEIYTYEYITDGVIEKKNGVNYRTFTIQNGNVTKVEHLIYNSDNQITGKEEYLFTDYDNGINLLKGKYYINGALFKAFSNNNYKGYKYYKYHVDNGNYIVDIYLPLTMDFGNSDDYSRFLFTQSCD